MKPTRAAWLFAIGLAWLVLRGLLEHAFPALRAEYIAQQGGILLVVPVMSLAASLAAPIFFASLLRHHDFSAQRGLRSATVFALVASLASTALVLTSLFLIVRGPSLDPGGTSWALSLTPLVFVLSIFVFLLTLARIGDVDPELRSAARVGAIGTTIPIILIVAWIVNSLYGVLPWYPAFSQGLLAKILGLGAATALFWFLETFAKRYDKNTG